MKKYYSVKEAAKLLGFSTNTVYKYLKEGKLSSRRIGRGRFRIPIESLAPFVDINKLKTFNASTQITDSQQPNINTPNSIEEQNVNVNNIQGSLTETDNPSVREFRKTQPTTSLINNTDIQVEDSQIISVDNQDTVFIRLFKGLSMIGFSIVYLFTANNFNFNIILYDGLADLFAFILPYLLLSSGLTFVFGFIYPKLYAKYSGFFHIYATIVLGYFSFIAVTSENYGLFVFSASILALIVAHLVKGLKSIEGMTLSSEFNKYSLSLVLLGGSILILFPQFAPWDFLADFLNTSKSVFAFIWFGLFIPVLIYMLNPNGRRSGVRVPFYFLTGVFAIMIGNSLMQKSIWDVAFISIFTGIFALFIAFWLAAKMQLYKRKIVYFSLAFVWVTSAILFGTFTVRSAQQSALAKAKSNLQASLNQVTGKVNEIFDKQQSIILTFSGQPDLVNQIKDGNKEELITQAKLIYDKLDYISRVILYNSSGEAVGVYPRNTLTQGTDFSSREYYIKTIENKRSYISPLFENILGTNTVIQTEPIFEGNQAVGMIGIAYSLEDLNSYLNTFNRENVILSATDSNGVYVLNTDKERIGQKVLIQSSINKNAPAYKQKYSVAELATSPNWKLQVESTVVELINGQGSIDNYVTAVLLVNALISIWAGLTLSSRKQNTVIDKPTNKMALDSGGQGIQATTI